MKKLIACSLIFATIFIACKKSDAPAVPPQAPEIPSAPANFLVTSVNAYDTATHILTIDSFVYDSHQRLQSYSLLRYDSSTQQMSPNSPVILNYNGLDTLPVSVTLAVTAHTILYDDHQRPTLDSSAITTSSFHASYGDNVIYTVPYSPRNWPL